MSAPERKVASAWLNTAAILMATSCLTPLGAFAACAPDPASAGASVSCTGTDANGIQVFANGVSITVAPGATVSNGGESVVQLSGEDGRFLNQGSITGSAQPSGGGVVLRGLRSSGTNQGTINISGGVSGGVRLGFGLTRFVNAQGASIIGPAFGIVLEDGFGGAIDNNGTISGPSGGILNGTSLAASINNGASGIIEGSIGILHFGAADFAISNAGTIRSTDASKDGRGLDLRARSVVDNAASGKIIAEGQATAIYSTANIPEYGRVIIDNAGLIQADGIAVDGANYVLTNTGKIEGDLVGAIGRQDVLNAGHIAGSIALGDDNDLFENSGIVTEGVDLGAGSDVFRNLGGSVGSLVPAGVQLGSGDDFHLTDPSIKAAAFGVDPGEGVDSIGYTLGQSATVTPFLADDYERFAIETRTSDTVATLSTDSKTFESTIAVFGRGTVINEGKLAVTGSEAIQLITTDFIETDPNPDDTAPFGLETMLINAGDIVSTNGAYAIASRGLGNDTVINRGTIFGGASLGAGDDQFINVGSIQGAVVLGAGDDFYLVAVESDVGTGGASGGNGFDSIGFYTDTVASGVLSPSFDFEGAAVRADTDASQFTILPGSSEPGKFYVTLLGDGTIINKASFSTYERDQATIRVEGDGLTFRNEGNIDGFAAVRLQGTGQTFINDADITREINKSDSTGNGGFVEDIGLGNTIINNADIVSYGFNTEAVRIGGDRVYRADFTSDEVSSILAAGGDVPVTRLINNGLIKGDDTASSEISGLVVSSYADVEIENTGEISGVEAIIRRGDLSVWNRSGGTIGSDQGVHILMGVLPTQADKARTAQQDPAQPSQHTITVHIDNDSGAVLNNLLIGGVVDRDKAAELAQDLDINIQVENKKGGTITGDFTIDPGISTLSHEGNPTTVSFATTVSNAGEITGEMFFNANANAKIENAGVIDVAGDAITFGGGANSVINTGEIAAIRVIVGGDGIESVTNSGSLTGSLALQGGDDMVTLLDGSSINGDIDGGNGVDKIASSGDAAFAGKVTGVETLDVTGGILLADLGTGSAIANTSVKGGAFVVGGSLAGNIAVAEGAVLAGTGTVTGNVTNAGAVSPGNSIGTLTINGKYTQSSTGQLFVELGSGSADKLTVTGAAALDGVLTTGLVAQDLSTLEGKSYTVLTAGSISGALDTTGTVQQGFWTLNVQQTGTAVTVTVTDVDVTIGASVPVTTSLADAIAAAAAGTSQGGGIVGEDGGIVVEGGGVIIDGGVITKDDSGQGATSLSYDSLGDWEAAAPTFVAGWNDMGARTPAGAMPKTGSAEFAGTTKGELTENGSPEAFVVEGNVLLTANFASGLVNADFTGMEKIDSHGVASAWTDFRARMSIADGTSEFAGTAGSDDGAWNGKAKGGFYGDEGGMPDHAAGMWSLSSSLGQAVGGFMAKRQ